jgi:Fe2+ or Zn2+ uptake regulation protein
LNRAEGLSDGLGKIGIDVTEKRMRVLASLIILQEENKAAVGFDDIYGKLEEIENKKPGKKPLIYRYLTSLEEDGFVEVNRRGYRHEYWTDFQRIRKAVDNARKSKTVEFEEKSSMIEDKINRLKNLDLNEMSSLLIQTMTGSKPQPKSRYAFGPENVYWLIDREIYNRARQGDVIRFVFDWINPEMEKRLDREVWGSELLSRGVALRALMSIEVLKDDDVYARRAIPYRKWKEKGWDLEVRIRTDSTPSYQFISLNDEGIILIVAENPVTATWMPKDVNPPLVEDALQRFDKDFESAYNPEDIFSDRKEG